MITIIGRSTNTLTDGIAFCECLCYSPNCMWDAAYRAGYHNGHAMVVDYVTKKTQID